MSLKENPRALPIADEGGAGAPDEKPAAGRASLRPLLALKPYLLRHPTQLAGAAVALVVAAMAFHDEEAGLHDLQGPVVGVVSGGNVEPDAFVRYLAAPLPG